MPRTKMPRKKSSLKKKGPSLMIKTSASVESLPSSTSERSDELNDLLTTIYPSVTDFQKAYEGYYQRKVDAHVKKYESCCKYVKDLFFNMMKNYPESYLNSTIHSPYESCFQDQNSDPKIKAITEHKSRLQTNETTDFKKPRTPRKDRASRKRSLSAPTPATDIFKTPLNSARQQMAMVKTITPKVSNTPISVMRRPQHGEVAFSTSGSPLLIGPVSREDIPTVSVPMQDGRVFSILPDPGIPPPDLPDFDDVTKQYLKTLREHLAMLAPTSP